ncbi:hypothetical protein ACFVGV_07515 [Pseudarthrobacter scleromae]
MPPVQLHSTKPETAATARPAGRLPVAVLPEPAEYKLWPFGR